MFVVLYLFSFFFFLPTQAQPINGCYIGAYLGCGTVDSSCISPTGFNALYGKTHYCFSRYVDAGNDSDLLNSSHWDWADTLASLGAKPVFFLMPLDGLINYSNGSRDASLLLFADSCAAFNNTIYIVFGHEMNGTWYPYGGTPQEYVDAFRHVSTLLKSIAPNLDPTAVGVRLPLTQEQQWNEQNEWITALYNRDSRS